MFGWLFKKKKITKVSMSEEQKQEIRKFEVKLYMEKKDKVVKRLGELGICFLMLHSKNVLNTSEGYVDFFRLTNKYGHDFTKEDFDKETKDYILNI